MKKSNFNIVYFLIIFLLLYYSFYVYVGILSPGGKFYSAYLEEHVNIPEWLSDIVAKISLVTLKLFGYTVHQKNPANVTVGESRGVNIAWACLGMGVISAWIAFVSAHKQTFTYKLKWLCFGVFSIYIINIIRVMMIALSNYYHWIYIRSFNAHTTFNIITYIAIIILMGIFVHSYNRKLKTYE